MPVFRTTCTVQSVASLVGGAALLLVPGPLLGLFGLAGPDAAIVARILGGVLFALGATLLGVRDVTDRDQRTRVIVGNLSCDGSVAILLLSASASGALGAAGWALTALFAANAASWLFAYRHR